MSGCVPFMSSWDMSPWQQISRGSKWWSRDASQVVSMQYVSYLVMSAMLSGNFYWSFLSMLSPAPFIWLCCLLPRSFEQQPGNQNFYLLGISLLRIHTISGILSVQTIEVILAELKLEICPTPSKTRRGYFWCQYKEGRENRAYLGDVKLQSQIH